MPRPQKPRLVEFVPTVTYFKPPGIPLSMLDEVRVGVDELEALRLKDMEGLEQEECAGRMDLAQSTFQRILSAARGKLTRAIVEGKAIRIEGGKYKHVARQFLCPDCGWRWEGEPAGRARGSLECPECGNVQTMPRRRRGRGSRPRD